jgi:predicted O-methyltransferase YrrM
MKEKILAVLKELEKTRDEFWNIVPEDGQLLHLLIKLSGAQRVLELGTSNGYSTIWLAETGAEVVTMEKWPERIEEAKKNFEKAGVKVQIVEGDMLENIPKLEGKFDFVFIDGKKSEYLDCFKLLKGKLTEKAVVTAHNVINRKELLKDYLDFVKDNFESVTIPIGKGTEVTLIEKF